MESVLEDLYRPLLKQAGIDIVALTSRANKMKALEEMALSDSVGKSKLDVALYLVDGQCRRIFGGVHVKASLAERVSDDVPTSREMRARGFWSPLWTLDVKSFPPPHGDLVNRGELGSPEAPSDKRLYVEEHGSFDNCYTANARSRPTVGETKSGKRIISLNLASQPDQFVSDCIAFAESFRARTTFAPTR